MIVEADQDGLISFEVSNEIRNAIMFKLQRGGKELYILVGETGTIREYVNNTSRGYLWEKDFKILLDFNTRLIEFCEL